MILKPDLVLLVFSKALYQFQIMRLGFSGESYNHILFPTKHEMALGFIRGLTLLLYLALEPLITVGCTFHQVLIMQEL